MNASIHDDDDDDHHGDASVAASLAIHILAGLTQHHPSTEAVTKAYSVP